MPTTRSPDRPGNRAIGTSHCLRSFTAIIVIILSYQSMYFNIVYILLTAYIASSFFISRKSTIFRWNEETFNTYDNKAISRDHKPCIKSLQYRSFLYARPRRPRYDSIPYQNELQSLLDQDNFTLLYPTNHSMNIQLGRTNSSNVLFPEMEQAGIDEKALRASPFGKVLFSTLEFFFPVFKEPNWFDLFDPPLTAEENLDLPYFDGYDFVNSTWTFYVRRRFGAWNWFDRLGLVPQQTHRVFLRQDGKTVWSDGFYGNWYINPAINFIQIEKHYGRRYGWTQYQRGMRLFQIQRWNFEKEVGRYWNRGLRSYLRNETNYWAIEGKVWSTAVKWRPFPRDEGKFIAIRDGTNLTAVFGPPGSTPWEERFHHAMSLPFYQAHPDQLERIEDNFDRFYFNQLQEEIR